MHTAAGDSFVRLATALAPRYRIEREIGRGGMATVYLAYDLEHDRDVAIKVLRPEHAATIAASRFLHEIRLAGRLQHPRLVPLHDSGEARGMLYYVMPYIRGQSLRQRLATERQLPVPEALRIAREVAEGLACAHASGIIHRDIKPENILLSEGHALLADFGIARAAAEAGSTAFTTSGTFVGTPLYASPEQTGGSQQVDGRTDLYSLACVVYEMLAGEPPFTGPTPQAILAKHALEPRPSVRVLRDTVPPGVDEALRRGMARVPADRFASVAEFAATLERHASDRTTPAPFAVTRPDRPAGSAAARRAPWPRRLRRRLVAPAFARTRLLGYAAALALGGLVLLRTVPPLLRNVVDAAEADYRGTPAWSVWNDVAGEFFSVVAAADSLLLVHSLAGDSLYIRTGGTWSAAAVPDSFTLRPIDGTLPGRRLLARRTSPGNAGLQYAWLQLTPRGLEETERLPLLPAERVLGSGWTDGRETVIWTDGLDRLERDRWTRENTRTTGWIRSLWGADFQHRMAVTSNPADSLLEYDGVGWRALDILPERSAGMPSYRFGAALGDGGSVVLGENCDSLACSPVVLQQDRFGAPWRALQIPVGIGIPGAQAPLERGACADNRFELGGAGGRSASDYYVWGHWTRCSRLPRPREARGCPPGWPCTWHVSGDRITPVPEFRGLLVRAVQPTAADLYALADDGILWQRASGGWRVVDQVPGLLERRLAASALLLIGSVGTRVRYEPAAGDTIATRVQFPLAPRPPLAFQGIRALAAADSALVVVAADGSVFRSACAHGELLPGAPERALRCGEPLRLVGPGPVLAAALLRDGAVLAVGPGGAWYLSASGATRERLPEPALQDTLWAISVAADGMATVAGRRLLLERAPGGRWTLLRRFPAALPAEGQFAVLAEGRIVTGSRVLSLWERTGDARPRVLRRAAFGDAEVSALYALADGRLVAGFATALSSGASGSLQVWADPAHDHRSEQLLLPISVAVHALATDGFSLFVAGPGGIMTVPLAALPFGRGASPVRSPQ